MHVRARLNTLLVVLVWIRESWYGAFFVRLLWVVCEPELLAVVIGVLLYACNTKILNLLSVLFFSYSNICLVVRNFYALLAQPGFNIKKTGENSAP
jgi:hypothetical protein